MAPGDECSGKRGPVLDRLVRFSRGVCERACAWMRERERAAAHPG